MNIHLKQKYVLEREHLKQTIVNSSANIIYLAAPDGYGKTTLLKLINDDLKNLGEHVQHIDANALSNSELKKILSDLGDDVSILLIDNLNYQHQNFIDKLVHSETLDLSETSVKIIFAAPPLYIDLLRARATGNLMIIGADELAFNQDEIKKLAKRFAVNEASLLEQQENIPIFVSAKLWHLSQNNSSNITEIDLTLFVDRFVKTLLSNLGEDNKMSLFCWAILDDFGFYNGEKWKQIYIANSTLLAQLIDGYYCKESYSLHWAFKQSLIAKFKEYSSEKRSEIINQIIKDYEAQDAWYEQACLLAFEKKYQTLSEHLIEVDVFKKIVVEGVEKFVRLLDIVPKDKFVNSAELNIAKAFTIAKQGYMVEAAEMIEVSLQEVGVYLPLPHQLIAAGDKKTRNHIFNILLCNSLLYFYVDKKLFKKDFLILEQMELLLEDNDYLSKGLLANVRCYLFLRHGKFEDSYEQCKIAQYNYRLIGAHYLQIFVYIHTASCLLSMKGCKAAHKQIMLAKQLADEKYANDKNLNTLINIIYADIVFEQGREYNTDIITTEMIEVQKDGESWLDLFIKSFRLITSNLIITKQISKLDETLSEIEQIAEDRQIEALNSFVTYRKLESLLIFGKHKKATKFIKQNRGFFESSFKFDENLGHWQEKIGAAQSYCRFLIDDGQHHKAINILNLLIEQCQMNKAQRPLLKCLILKAYALQYTKGLSSMFETFEEALMVGLKHDFVRVFIEESQKISIILKHWTDRSEFKNELIDHHLLAFTSKIIDARDKVIANHSVQFNGYQFNKHQSNILSYLLQGLKNKEIAICLNVSEATVRFHLKKIYKSVGVSNRKKLIAILTI